MSTAQPCKRMPPRVAGQRPGMHWGLMGSAGKIYAMLSGSKSLGVAQNSRARVTQVLVFGSIF